MEKRKFVISESGVKVFVDPRDNILIDRDNPALVKKINYLREKYSKGTVKGLSRLGSENREKAPGSHLQLSIQKLRCHP